MDSEDTTKTWLSNNFFEKLLRTSENDESIKVASHEVTRATAAGDNYGSEMYRVKVNFTVKGRTDMKSIIAKSEPRKEKMKKILAEGKLFERESEALGVISPKIHCILEQALNEKIQPFSARLLYSHLDPPSFLILMEDLKVEGFRIADRTVGLDIEHCLLTLRNLARYHAASLVLLENEPDAYYKLYSKSVFCEEIRSVIESIFEKGTRNLAKEIESWPEFGSQFADKIHKIADISVDYIIKCMAVNEADFNVLNHGDLWLNNLMFRYSETDGKVQDMRFVDFQGGYFGDVAIDLQNFIHTSPTIETMKNQSILVEEYHKTLGETFLKLGRRHLHPSLDQLNKQLDKKGLYAVLVAISFLQFSFSDRREVPDMEKVLKNEETVRFSQAYKNAMKELLPIFEKKGWLSLEKQTNFNKT